MPNSKDRSEIKFMVYPSMYFETKEKDFLPDLIQTNLKWEVKDSELTRIRGKKDFVETHIRNTRSPLVITKRILAYPNSVIFALCTITGRYCLSRLLNYLATEGRILFTSFNPHFVGRDADYILIYLFGCYFEHRFKGQKIVAPLMNDYIYMALDVDGAPNLRIKSFGRLAEEHNKLVSVYELGHVPEFEVPDAAILPAEKCGYHFSCITNKKLLIEEAQEMQSCVAIYASKIISGNSILYRITGKERATVEFIASEEGYQVAQIFSYNNGVVSDELKAVIFSLIKESSKDLSDPQAEILPTK